MQSALKYRTETRLTSIEYQKLKKYCKQHHTTHSKLIRNFLDNLTENTVIKPNHNSVDKIKKLKNEYKNNNQKFNHLANIRSSLDEVTHTAHDGVFQIARVGNNLNQIAKQANKGNLDAVTAKALDKVRKVVTGATVLFLKKDKAYKDFEKEFK